MTDTALPHPVLIRADGVRIARDGRMLAREIALVLRKGEALALMGDNGAGKTTLLRALAGLVRPEAGRIDRPVPAAWAGHADGLKSSESVRDALEFWAKLHGSDQTAIDAALSAFAIAHLAERACGRLSAGQRRRVALARAVLSGRPLWLLDEPAAPLDAKGRRLLAAAVARHREAGGAVIAATHQALDWSGLETLQLEPAW